jgi:hypothetical protein
MGKSGTNSAYNSGSGDNQSATPIEEQMQKTQGFAQKAGITPVKL